jgi:phosphoglycolate phosphatase
MLSNKLHTKPHTYLVLFDCDGTMVDSAAQIIAAFSKACKAMGIATPPATHIRQQIGRSLDQVIATLFAPYSPQSQQDLAHLYRQAFAAQRQALPEAAPLYPGLLPCLETLSQAGVMLGIATGKSRRGLLALLDKHQLGGYFHTLHTADDAPGKPDPTMAYNAMAACGVTACQSVMVGDTTYDMAMAQEALMSAVGVGWGYHAPEMLLAAGAEKVVDDYAELTHYILSHRFKITSSNPGALENAGLSKADDQTP